MKIFEVEITPLNYSELLTLVKNSIEKNSQITITYVTAATLNQTYKNNEFQHLYSTFDFIHPDGTGIFLASKILFGKKGLKTKITGSDFYPLLEKKIMEKNWSVYFLGDTKKTLFLLSNKKISPFIIGSSDGFTFDTEKVISEINQQQPDILIVGMGFPKQEKWVVKNKNRLQTKVILCVGEGIKVFAGNKVRGNKLIRKLGLEWLARLIAEPQKLWKRYLIGIPVFIYRIIILKLKSTK